MLGAVGNQEQAPSSGTRYSGCFSPKGSSLEKFKIILMGISHAIIWEIFAVWDLARTLAFGILPERFD
jgi:hypothetical protein